jgi:type I restriction enzyme S subunit
MMKVTRTNLTPEDWEVKKLNEVADFTRGFSYKGSEKSGIFGEFPFITLNSVNEGGGFKGEFSYISSSRLKERHFINKGQIFIANTEQTRTGTLLGSPALTQFPRGYAGNKGVFSHHITKVTVRPGVDKNFIYYYLIFIQKKAAQYNTGSVIWALDVENWSRQEDILLPPFPEQVAISSIPWLLMQRWPSTNK